jgi:hypothetical protein
MQVLEGELIDRMNPKTAVNSRTRRKETLIIEFSAYVEAPAAAGQKFL